MNCDGVVDVRDVPDFVAALLSTGDADPCVLLGDMEGSGAVDGDDVQPFLVALYMQP